jgi:probable O-glycosylation ligase (exosortase A-associated)
MIYLCLTSKVRIDAFIWMMVFCIGYYSIKGGLAFLISGGAYRFEGPAGTMIGDNNHLALAFLLSLPLMNYLRLLAARPMVRAVMTGWMVLTVLAVLCTQSRGGFIGLVVLGGAFWWMSGRRLGHLAAVVAIGAIAAAFASQALVSRLQTIETAHEQDNSFLGRVVSWQVHAIAAFDRPLIGAGPYALQTFPVFAMYRPEHPIVDVELKPVAAHSIYFQVLGDHGFIAFGLFLMLIWVAWRNASWVMERAGGEPSRLWMYHLAGMTRLGLMTFAVSGAAVSMAFYDYFLAMIMLTACLRRQLTQEVTADERGTDGRRRRLASPLLVPRPAGRVHADHADRA